jgi:two-component system, OmpR family, sensor histidine kinase MtrB
MTDGAGAVLALAAIACATGVLTARSRRKRRYAFAESLHELRGAITAIQLGTSALTAHPDDRQHSRIDAICTQIERAEVAIGDLEALVSSRRASIVRDPHELVDVSRIVRQRATAWDRIAFGLGGGVELRWSLGPTIVRADPRRLCQALDNVIANGLEHGGGLVTLAGAREGGVVHVKVSDRGCGIGRALDDLPRAPWHAAHGHGLAIARRVIELHRGRLRATSGSAGTEFEIELPVAS